MLWKCPITTYASTTLFIINPIGNG